MLVRRAVCGRGLCAVAGASLGLFAALAYEQTQPRCS